MTRSTDSIVTNLIKINVIIILIVIYFFVEKDCTSIRLSSTYGGFNCNGDYQYAPELKAKNAPDYPVFKHVSEDRCIYWTYWGRGEWACSLCRYLADGNYSKASKYFFLKNICGTLLVKKQQIGIKIYSNQNDSFDS